MKTALATPETDREPAFGEHWGVTTSSKFNARKFWRGVIRPLAPAQSGDARGPVRSAVVSMSSRRSQDQPGLAFEDVRTRRDVGDFQDEAFGSHRDDGHAPLVELDRAGGADGRTDSPARPPAPTSRRCAGSCRATALPTRRRCRRLRRRGCSPSPWSPSSASATYRVAPWDCGNI